MIAYSPVKLRFQLIIMPNYNQHISQAYRATLQKSCEANREKEYGWVNWTVAAETPDEVYYQSFFAYGLGWKIKVLDEGEEPSQGNHPNAEFSFYTYYFLTAMVSWLLRALVVSIL